MPLNNCKCSAFSRTPVVSDEWLEQRRRSVRATLFRLGPCVPRFARAALRMSRPWGQGKAPRRILSHLLSDYYSRVCFFSRCSTKRQCNEVKRFDTKVTEGTRRARRCRATGGIHRRDAEFAEKTFYCSRGTAMVAPHIAGRV